MLPNRCEPSVVEYSSVATRGSIFEHIPDRLREPLRVQYDDIAEAFIVTIIDDLPKIVKQFDKGNDFVFKHLVATTRSDELFIGYMWFVFCSRQDLVASCYPSRMKSLTHVWKVRSFHCYRLTKGSNTIVCSTVYDVASF